MKKRRKSNTGKLVFTLLSWSSEDNSDDEKKTASKAMKSKKKAATLSGVSASTFLSYRSDVRNVFR